VDAADGIDPSNPIVTIDPYRLEGDSRTKDDDDPNKSVKLLLGVHQVNDQKIEDDNFKKYHIIRKAQAGGMYGEKRGQNHEGKKQQDQLAFCRKFDPLLFNDNEIQKEEYCGDEAHQENRT